MVLATSLWGQDAWADAQVALGIRARTGSRWVLCTAPESFDRTTLTGARLASISAYLAQSFPEDAAAILRDRSGSPPGAPVWALVSPAGELVASGKGSLDGPAWLSLLKSYHHVPRWELREAFLREHPDQGDAHLEAFLEAMAVAWTRTKHLATRGGARIPEPSRHHLWPLPSYFGDAETSGGSPQAREILGEVAATLTALMEVPAWSSDPRISPALAGLAKWDLSQFPDLRALALRAFRELRAQNQIAPLKLSERPHAVHLGLALELPLEEIQPLFGPPRHPLPPPTDWDSFMTLPVAQRYGWEQALVLLEGWECPEAIGAPSPESSAIRSHWLTLHALERITCLAHLGRLDALGQALADLQRGSGAAWEKRATHVRGLLESITPGLSDRFSQQLQSPSLPSPPPEVDAAPGIPHGPGAPPLQRHRVIPSALLYLDEEIQRRPTELVLRRMRAEGWLPLHPRGDREALVAEDARLSRMPLVFPSGWHPAPDPWAAAALKHLPDLERELVSWPSRTEAWRSWCQWARLHPGHPSLAALIQRMAPWGPHPDWQASLPREVHHTLAAEWRAGKRFEPMRRWFQSAWEGVSAELEREIVHRSTRPQRLQVHFETLVSPLIEALTALGRVREAHALRTDFARRKQTLEKAHP